MAETKARAAAAASLGGLRRPLEYALPVVLVAVLGNLDTIWTWWFHDDWLFLADAAGIADRDTSWVRVVTYDWYWRLCYTLLGTVTWRWGLTRLAMHAASSLLTARLAGHAGLGRHGQILAGMLFAAAPVAFESLYWGTGAVELLGVLFTLAALERWLAGGPRARWTALALTALAIGSKEAGLLLPLVFAADLARQRAWRTPLWGGLVALVGLGVVAAMLMLGDFATTDDYAVNPRLVPRNFLVYGTWLLTPAVLLRDATLAKTTSMYLGVWVWLLWAWAARREAGRGRPALVVCLGLGVLSILPATVLGDHAVPRYLYGPTAAVAITFAYLVFRERGPSTRTLLLLVPLLILMTWTGVAFHRNARFASGRAFHRLVFKERVSHYLSTHFVRAGIGPQDRVLIVQDPSTNENMKRILQDCMAGDLALKFVAGSGASLTWVQEVGPDDVGAFVFTTKGENLVPEGWVTGGNE